VTEHVGIRAAACINEVHFCSLRRRARGIEFSVLIVSHALEDDVAEWLVRRCPYCGAKDTFSREFDELHREIISFRFWYVCAHAILIVAAAHGFHWI